MALSDEEIVNIKSALENKETTLGDIRVYIKKIRKLTELNDVDESFFYELKKREAALRSIYRSKAVNFVSVKNGFLAIGGRPGPEKPAILKEMGTTTIVTLLKTSEKNVPELGEIIESLEINWVWFPFSAGRADLTFEEELVSSVNQKFDEIIQLLENGEKVFIHCAAGIHRTGIFTSGLLRKCGLSKTETRELVKQIRPVTALEAISRHWEWSETVIERGNESDRN